MRDGLLREMRLVQDHDEALIFQWRNDKLTRSMSVDRRPVPQRSHHKWFTTIRPDTMWIGIDHDGAEVGVFRGDAVAHEEGNFEVAITISPKHRGRRLAADLIYLGTQTLRDRYGAVKCIAKIRIRNTASIRAFQHAGYFWERADKEKQFVYLAWEKL